MLCAKSGLQQDALSIWCTCVATRQCNEGRKDQGKAGRQAGRQEARKAGRKEEEKEGRQEGWMMTYLLYKGFSGVMVNVFLIPEDATEHEGLMHRGSRRVSVKTAQHSLTPAQSCPAPWGAH